MNDHKDAIEEDETGKSEARWALIAGACEEAGREAAHALARHGVNLHLMDTNGGELAALTDEIEHSFDIETECHVMDLREHLNAEVLALECDNADILIVCPGPAPMGGLMELDEDDWRKGFESRVTATISLVREFYETLQDRGAGIIVLDISPPDTESSAESNADPGSVQEDDFCSILAITANGALAALIRVLEKQSAGTGVRVLETNTASARELIDGLVARNSVN